MLEHASHFTYYFIHIKMVRDHMLMDISGDISNEPQVSIILRTGVPPIHRVQWCENEGFSSTSQYKDTQWADMEIDGYGRTDFEGVPWISGTNDPWKVRSMTRIRAAKHMIQWWDNIPDSQWRPISINMKWYNVHTPGNPALFYRWTQWFGCTPLQWPPKIQNYIGIHHVPPPGVSWLIIHSIFNVECGGLRDSCHNVWFILIQSM